MTMNRSFLSIQLNRVLSSLYKDTTRYPTGIHLALNWSALYRCVLEQLEVPIRSTGAAPPFIGNMVKPTNAKAHSNPSDPFDIDYNNEE
jgi:hypothetical protein